MPFEVSYDLSSLNILLVDDSAFMRELMGTIMNNLGVGQVISVFNGDLAMTELIATAQDNHHRVRQFDVVISDWAMKPTSGLELLKWIRNHEHVSIRYLPFIMLTAYSTADWVCRARDWGVTEFLTKPVSAQSVAQRLLSVIERPRPFIRCINYFGPDRRRHISHGFSGPERRRGTVLTP